MECGMRHVICAGNGVDGGVEDDLLEIAATPDVTWRQNI